MKVEITLGVALCLVVIMIASSSNAQSGLCGANVPFYYADLSGDPDSIYISPPDVRKGSCCGSVFPDRCIEFEILLDTNAIGIMFDIYSGAEPPGALFYQISCGTPVPVGSVICLSGPGPHILTFCKPGNNPNQYAITSIPAVIEAPDKFITEGCAATLEVTGLVDSTVTWTEITSGTEYYNSYLSCTSSCLTTSFNTQPGFPSFIDFQVCGMLYSSQCPTIQKYMCDTMRLFIAPTLQVFITHDTVPICDPDTSRLLVANVTAASSAVGYVWSNGLDGSGTIAGSDSSFIVTAPGDYSVIVYDSLYPACSRDTASITIQFNPRPSILIAGDSLICKGGSATLYVAGANNLLWAPGVSLSCDTCTSATAFPDISTLYRVTGTDSNGCPVSDSFLVEVASAHLVDLPVVICQGDSFFARGAYQYTPGLYIDSLTSAAGCDSIIRTALIVLNKSASTRTINICESDSIWAGGAYQAYSGTYYDTLTALNGCDSVVTTNLIEPSSVYRTVTVCFGEPYLGVVYTHDTLFADTLISWSGCDSIIITDLKVSGFDIDVDPGIDTITAGESVQLNVSSAAAIDRHIWFPISGLSCTDCSSPLASPHATTSYTVAATDENGCLKTGNTRIVVVSDTAVDANDCSTSFYIPNAFSPNGDGVNDVYYIYGKGIKEFQLTIYNRWGEKVFESSDLSVGWDGTYNGSLQNPGMYVYHARIENCKGNKTSYKSSYQKGSLALLK